MHSKRLTAVLSAVAFTLTAAASASSVITLAEETETGETKITTQTVEESQETVSSIAMDVEGYEEEETDTELPEETETEQETIQNKEDRTSRAEEEKIRLAESRTVLALSVNHVDVGNRVGYDVSVTDFPFTETAYAYADNEKVLWDLFKSLGFTDAGAAGAMGNLAMESGLKPSSRSKNFDYANGTGGGGLAGWMCAGRFKSLMSMAEKNGVSWQDLSVQMAFLQYELENTRKDVGQRMKTETDVDMAADYFCVHFEGCVGHTASTEIDGISLINGKWYQGLKKRKALARGFYEKYAEGTP